MFNETIRKNCQDRKCCDVLNLVIDATTKVPRSRDRLPWPSFYKKNSGNHYWQVLRALIAEILPSSHCTIALSTATLCSLFAILIFIYFFLEIVSKILFQNTGCLMNIHYCWCYYYALEEQFHCFVVNGLSYGLMHKFGNFLCRKFIFRTLITLNMQKYVWRGI